jgi:hypothetical protein
MKLYHGSPEKVKILKPYQAKGMNEFQNKKAIFLTKDFHQAALYAISKSLKSKTQFALPPKKIIIVGDFKTSKGYVYEVELKKEEIQKGELGEYEFAYTKPMKNFKLHQINPECYKESIIYVKTKKEMMEIVEKELSKSPLPKNKNLY